MWLAYSSNKQFTQFIRFCLFVLSAWSLLITITYDMSFPNWVLIFASSGNAMIELFVFMLGFRQESSKLINLMYFKQTSVDLLVFLIMGVAVQSIFYRMGMAHRIIWFCCCIERFGRLTELFSFEETVEAVFWWISYLDFGGFIIWVLASLYFCLLLLLYCPLIFWSTTLDTIPEDKDAERELLAWWISRWVLSSPIIFHPVHAQPHCSETWSITATNRPRIAHFDLLKRVLSKVPNSDNETRMVRMAGGDYGALKKTN